MKWRDGWYWLGAVLLVFLMSACSNNDSDPSRSPLKSDVTTLGNTVYTDDVVSDGSWIVWEGRKQNFLFYDGTKAIDLSGVLGPEYSLGNDRDNDWRGIAFDGRYVVFMADDVTDSAPPQPFALDTQASKIKAVQIGVLTEDNDFDNEEIAFADGIFVWMMDSDLDEPEVFYYNFNAATPEAVQLTDNSTTESYLVVSGNTIAWLQEGNVWYMDFSDTAQTAPEQGSTSGAVTDLVAADGIFAWVDGTDVYYVVNGGDAAIASDSTDSNPIGSLAVGPGIIAWTQGTEIRYHDVTTEEGTVEVVATSLSGLWDLGVGDGFIGWSEDTEGYVYFIGDATDDNRTFATDIDSGDYHLSIDVTGSRIFYLEDLKDTGIDYPDTHNPSSYLQVYDPVTDMTVEADSTDYQRILLGAVADDMAIWFGHAANRTLYGMKAGDLTSPIAITPPEMNARQPQIDNGILAFKALDRTDMDGLEQNDDVEIYYCKLNANGRPITRVTDDDLHSDAPRIGGNLIFWYENESIETSWYHNIDTGVTTELTAKEGNDHGGATDGRYFVWYDDAEVHYFDTTTETDVVVTSPNGYVQKCPSIADGLVTWVAADIGVSMTGISTTDLTGYSIYAIDFNDPALDPADRSASIIRIGPADESGQKPTTDGRFIVWGGDPGGDQDYALKYYDTASAAPAVETLAGDSISDVCNPRLSNGLMVWAAVEYGAESVDGDREIFAYDLNAAVPEVVQLTDNDLWDSQPSVLDGVITWRTGGSSQWDWYGKLAAAYRF